MLLLKRARGRAEALGLLTLDEYLTLPEDTRCEIVDGVVRPMARPDRRSRAVRRRLAEALRRARPSWLQEAVEDVVVLRADPPVARIELEPSIEVHVYRLINEVYRDEGVYTQGGLIKDPALEWLSIEVNGLLGDYA